MKKTVTVILSLVLMVTLLSAVGFAAEDTNPPVITKIEGESASNGPGVDKFDRLHIKSADDKTSFALF